HVRENVRRQHQTLRLAADDFACAAAARLLYAFTNGLELLLVDEWPNHRLRIARVADLEAAHALDEPLDERLVHLAVDDEAIRDHADLALVQKLAEHGRIDGAIEIGIVEHDERRVAAELELDALHDRRFGGELRNASSHGRRAGEGHDARCRMTDERIADLAARADHDVQHARRQPGFLEDLPEQQPAGNRRIARGLQHDGITDGERRGDGAVAELQRPVPWADDGDDADRKAVHAALLAGHVAWQNPPLQTIRRERRLHHHRAHRCPLELRFDLRAARFVDEPGNDLVVPRGHHL